MAADGRGLSMSEHRAEVVVVGGGPAGLTAAVALAQAGVETALLTRTASAPDGRTTALLAGSVTALDTLGIWGRCTDYAAPLSVMRIVDDTGRLIRAPEVRFAAAEIGLPAFGYNIENRHLLAALAAHVGDLHNLARLEDEAQSVVLGDDGVTIRLRSGDVISARLAVGADGRQSLCRAAARIETDQARHPQTALTFNLAHSRPHHDTSTEFHTAIGPFTLVPLPGMRSSLVFVVDPEEAPRLSRLPEAELAGEIERRCHSILGKVTLESTRGVFPLTTQTARHFGARRVILIGEAAHVMPPIGAQGLNLGLRDAATMAELVVAMRRNGGDCGSEELTSNYDRMRRADITSRMLAVDLLNRSLLSDFLPLQSARGFGLYLLQQVGPLRRAVMREGVSPLASQPRLMRGEPL
jgi:2-octaprenyl-6-methoxyphenol hydroxylase